LHRALTARRSAQHFLAHIPPQLTAVEIEAGASGAGIALPGCPFFLGKKWCAAASLHAAYAAAHC
jgi:hypothetical protein